MKNVDLLISSQLVKFFQGKDPFNYFWNLPKNWFEPPNYRRGGWSGVLQYHMPESDMNLFVKLQSTSVYKNIRYPIKGQPTFQREFIVTQRAKKIGVNTLDFAYYGRRGLDVILVSEALEGYQNLNQALMSTQQNPELRKKILTKLTDNMVCMHKAKLKHGALYEKHILVHISDENEVDVKFIDFEKSKRGRKVTDCVVRDIYCLYRHCDQLTKEDKDFIFVGYQKLLKPKTIDALRSKIVRKVAAKEKLIVSRVS